MVQEVSRKYTGDGSFIYKYMHINTKQNIISYVCERTRNHTKTFFPTDFKKFCAVCSSTELSVWSHGLCLREGHVPVCSSLVRATARPTWIWPLRSNQNTSDWVQWFTQCSWNPSEANECPVFGRHMWLQMGLSLFVACIGSPYLISNGFWGTLGQRFRCFYNESEIMSPVKGTTKPPQGSLIFHPA